MTQPGARPTGLPFEVIQCRRRAKGAEVVAIALPRCYPRKSAHRATMAAERDSASTYVSQASTSAGAVFLSYASKDAAAAERIATALRSAGIEIWFDKSELRGGDACDRQIRKQIHDCALFIPIISAHSHARLEGYFRREWKLAADRTHEMAEEKAFLVPVVIDDTSERHASVPDRFRDLQWTRLPSGEPSPAFIERVRRLLSPEKSPAPVWSAEILCGPSDGERCDEYGMIRECAAPSLLSCGW